MSKINADTIKTSNPNVDITLGAAGDAVLMPTGATLKNNTIKDSGGNTIFQSDGSGTLSNVNSAFSSADIKLLSSQTAAADTSSVSFTSGLSSTYNLYMFTWHSIKAGTNQAFFSWNGSEDSGSSYNITKTTTYWYLQSYEDGSPSGFYSYSTSRDLGQSDEAGTVYQKLDADNAANESDGCSTGVLYLFNPASYSGDPTTYGTPKWFCSQASNMAYDSSGLGNTNVFVSGYFWTQAAVDAVDFKMDSGTFSGTIKMYGIG